MPKVKGGRPNKSDKRARVTNGRASVLNTDKPKTKKPKQDSKSRELAVVIPANAVGHYEVLPPEQRKRLQMRRRRLRELTKLTSSEFKHDLPTLYDLVQQDNSIDELQKQFLHTCLRVVINIIPEMEDKLHKQQNEGGAYALKAMMAEGREIFHDIRALANSQLVAIRIADMVIDPAFRNIANFYVSTLHQLRSKVEELVPENDRAASRDYFQEVSRLFGETLIMVQNDIKDKILEEIA